MEEINEQVSTIDGSMELKTLCRNIRGVFYKIGDINIENSGQCYYINDKFYKYDTGYIVYDHRVKQYVIKKVNNIIEGVIDIVDNVPIRGTFTKSEYNDDIILNHNNNKYYCLNEDILKDSKFIEDLQSGEYYHRSILECIRFIRPSVVSDNYKRDLPYDSRGITSDRMDIYEELYTPVYNDTVEKYGAITKDLSFGLEFETSIGTVPKRICNKLGLIPLRDGSINGLEYVTIPLSGKKGIQTIVDTVQELDKRTEYDNDCSLHIHIGNIPRTEEFFLALFKVLNAIQDPFFALFPLHKKYNYGVKRKHYTKPFDFMQVLGQMDPVINDKNIKNNFSILYDFLSMGHSYADKGYNLGNVEYHPSDPHGTSKWNIRSRYYWVNLIPLLFGNKQTVEFRIHTPTYDINKIMNYLILCTSIVNYAKENTAKILTNPRKLSTLTLSDIVYTTNGRTDDGKILSSVYNYIEERKHFIYNKTKLGDIVANEDEFKLNYNDIHWGNNNRGLNIISKYSVFGDNVRVRLDQLINQIPEEPLELRWIGHYDAVAINDDDNDDNDWDENE